LARAHKQLQVQLHASSERSASTAGFFLKKAGKNKKINGS
jgi:hypothetical protein